MFPRCASTVFVLVPALFGCVCLIPPGVARPSQGSDLIYESLEGVTGNEDRERANVILGRICNEDGVCSEEGRYIPPMESLSWEEAGVNKPTVVHVEY